MLVRHGAASQLAWREVGFPLITQPAISPERNPPKQLRQEPRRCLEGHSYSDLDAQIARADAFPRELAVTLTASDP